MKQTGIFIDRFFHGWSYEDLAVKYDVSVDVAQKHYSNAVQRLQAVIEAMDGGKDTIRDFEPWKRMVEERSGGFPTGVRWFLLNKLFQMRPAEIARMENVKHPSEVRALIIRVSDQLKAGEISLFEADEPEKAEAAKDRLDAERAQRRKRYATRKGGMRVPMTPEEKLAKRKEYRDTNKERINAKRREESAKKKDPSKTRVPLTREEKLAKRRAYRAANKERINAQERERVAKDKDRINAKRRAAYVHKRSI